MNSDQSTNKALIFIKLIPWPAMLVGGTLFTGLIAYGVFIKGSSSLGYVIINLHGITRYSETALYEWGMQTFGIYFIFIEAAVLGATVFGAGALLLKFCLREPTR